MTTIDWKALKPHVPLGPGDAQYVERTGSAGDEIAQWILAGRSPLLVGGPAGVGKSTELARAAELLQPDRVACLVQLDRFENMRRLTPDRMRLRIAQKVGYLAQQVLHLPLSQSLTKALDKIDAELKGESVPREATPSALLNITLTEISRLSKQAQVTLLLDGLEKVPQGPESLDLFEALASIGNEVELVVVIPWHAAFGPQAETVIRTGERFLAVRAIEVEAEGGEGGRNFLRKILLQRLQLPEEALDADQHAIVDEAITWSGGMPRTFLQLIADAGLYGKMRTAAPWPRAKDLADAVADQQDSFVRLLLPGDSEAIAANVGSDGRELDLARKTRLLAHGFLLERLRDGRPVLQLHPPARRAIEEDRRA